MTTLPPLPARKLDLLFQGVRFTTSLGEAGKVSQPNFYPYKFRDGEPDPTGEGQAVIPYLANIEGDTLFRIKANADSPYFVSGSGAQGYVLEHDEGGAWPTSFEPFPEWMRGTCSDGTPMARTGVSLHGDMLVVNPAPACQYFTAKKRFGRRMRCAFCLYGAPGAFSKSLGQDIDEPCLTAEALVRIQETVNAAVAGGGIRHVYLVAGSMLDWEDEAKRYIQLSRALREGCPDLPYVACGSGALPDHALDTLHDEQLVDGVCFNLEVYGKELFEEICPGKAWSVGYEPWLRSLEQSVERWGRGNVYSAMVSGIELEPRYGGLSVDEAVARAMAGARDLMGRGVLPIFSLYWPLYGKGHEQLLLNLRDYFAALHAGYWELRKEHGQRFDPAFMCHRCSYMQLECDLDRIG